MVSNGVIRALGNTAVPSLIMTLAAVIKILLSSLLIFGGGFFPVMGFKGAALATVISRATSMLASLAFLYYREQMLLFTFPKVKEVWKDWKNLLHVGLPTALTNMITPASIGFITSLIASYGSEAVAGFGIASRVGTLALIGLIGLSVGIGPFVAQNWGAKKYERVKRALSLSFLLCFSWSILTIAFFFVTAPQIVSIFENNPSVVEVATAYLKIIPLSYGALGITLVCSSTFNALGKPLISLVITITRILLLYIPLTYIGSHFFGVYGVFWGLFISNIIIGLGVLIWINTNFKMSIL
ncbi:MAG: hypothetical protein F6K23_39330 [Okeania sp. SIO2C9]|nr:hypothetical protein [Okeania sp. SIO2C9]